MKVSFSRSLMSVATATLLMTGFAGCTTGDEGDTNAAVLKDQKTSYTATVSGAVMDDMGRPVEGAKVTVAGVTGTTDAQGAYNLSKVPVSSAFAYQLESDYSESVVACDEGCGMTVSVTAGEGFNTAFAEVGTMMVHFENGGNGSYDGDTFGDINTQPNSQSFTLHSDVGIVMLSRPIASVTGVIRDTNTGQAIAEGTKIIAKYNGVNDHANPGINGFSFANTVTSVNSVVGTVGAGGVFKLDGLLTSSDYVFILEGYSSDLGNEGNVGDDGSDGFAVRTNNSAAYYDGDFVTSTGNVYVLPIVPVDGIAPRVASVSNAFGMVEDYHWDWMGHQYNIGHILMLDRTVTNTITINFTEPMLAFDIENSVKVSSGNTYLTVSSVSLSGTQLTVTLADPLTDGQPIALYVFRDARLTDLEGNPLVFNGEADDEGLGWPVLNLDTCVDGCEDGRLDYLSCTASSRALRFDLMGYKQLNLNAEAASDGVQMELDTDVVRTPSSELNIYEEYSNAFNNVRPDGHDDGMGQLNNVSHTRYSSATGETAERLEDLKTALTGDGTQIETDVGRIQFVANNATSYVITVPDGAVCNPGNNWISVESGSCNVDSTQTGFGTYTVTGFKAGETVELTIDNVQHGDNVVIMPMDDLCMEGTPYEVALRDNVAPTTVLQNSYIGGTVYGGIGTVVAFGEGGELTNPYNAGGDLGMPALYITPGLLDYLDAAGNNILEPNNYVTGDETLMQELYVHNYPDNNYSDAPVYDATDWEEFILHLSRRIGVAFSEDVDLSGVTPTFEGTTVSDYMAVNNVMFDDAGHEVNRDLVAFTTSDVLELANNQTEKIMSFEGTKDLAGNPADASAKVMVLDGMPPFVTRAIFDGETVKITFNEPIVLQGGFFPAGVWIEGSAPVWYDPNDPTPWTLSGTVLTIDVTDIPGLDVSDFLATHNYDESALYGLPAGDYKHAIVHTNFIEDVHGNSWVSWSAADQDVFGAPFDASNNYYADLEPSPFFISFAMISNIGDFDVEVDNSGFVEADPAGAQTVVWDFNQPVRVGTVDDFFSGCNQTITDTTQIDTWFNYVDGGTTPLASTVTNATFKLSADCKKVTLTFTSIVAPGDQVTTSAGHVFTSNVDDTQNESLSASANAAP